MTKGTDAYCARLKRGIEAIFAGVGCDLDSAYLDLPDGQRVTPIAFANGLVKLEGEEWPDDIRPDVVVVLQRVAKSFPTAERQHLHWRIRPQLRGAGCYFRLGASFR